MKEHEIGLVINEIRDIAIEFKDAQQLRERIAGVLRPLLLEQVRLERVNKEWETLWEPIDDLVRPLTPLGESVRDKAVELINDVIGSLSPEFEDGVEFEGWGLRNGEPPIIEDGRYD